MPIAHWLVILLILAALYYRQQTISVLQWHPIITFSNAAIIMTVVGSYFMIRWVYAEYAWRGIIGLIVAGVFIHIWHRWKYGYWLGD